MSKQVLLINKPILVGQNNVPTPEKELLYISTSVAVNHEIQCFAQCHTMVILIIPHVTKQQKVSPLILISTHA